MRNSGLGLAFFFFSTAHVPAFAILQDMSDGVSKGKEADGKCNRIDEVSSPVRTQSKALSILLSLAASEELAGMKTTIGQTYWYGWSSLPLIGKPKAPIFLINTLIRLATINFKAEGACGAVGSIWRLTAAS